MAKRPPADSVPPDSSVSRITTALGANVRLARIRKNMTQQELADLVGVHVARVSALEKGHGNPRLSTLVRFAAALGLCVNALVTRASRRGQ
jgi:DNA-binding XRE family transcriptional regulator